VPFFQNMAMWGRSTQRADWIAATPGMILIAVESLYMVLAAVYAAMVTPINLLVFTLILGAAGALTSPAWQAVVPQLVPRDDLSAAIAANSVGVNISRAIGPALGGAMISVFGIVAPFWLNAISNLGIVGAPPADQGHCLKV
jgi:MFS family permease